MHWITAVAAGLIAAKWAAQTWLDYLNKSEVVKHAENVPEAFRDMIEPAAYTKGVDYTLAKIRLGGIERLWDVVILALVLFTGVLPASYNWWTATVGAGVWSLCAFLFVLGVVLAIPQLPFQWYDQFRLEERFGFNTTDLKTWITDRVKGLFLALVLGYPLLALILKLVEWMGSLWWLWAWGIMIAFQLLMMVLAPVLILPLFNKLTPLPEGKLRERLLALGHRTGFHARNILVMDGSKRSRHSNAFFTGFGKFRKIVLFDTLVEQLRENELEAVLAHEIGHYKKRHIPKMLAASALGLLLAFYLVGKLAASGEFYRAFGFEPGSIVPALVLFSLLSGVVTFWLTPLGNLFSRKYEYQADRYAAEAMNESGSLVGALRKLNEKNLSNLTPHPLYSAFYYSHPALLERERALMAVIPPGGD